MRARKIVILFLFMLVLASRAHARTRHFCVECHTDQEISSFKNVFAWEKSIYQEKHRLCPSVKQMKEERYFIESQLVKYAQMLDQLEQNRIITGRMEKNLLRQAIAYGEIGTADPASHEDIASKTIKVKNHINKVYIQINQARDRLKVERVFGLGLLATIAILFSILWGIQKTLKE